MRKKRKKNKNKLKLFVYFDLTNEDQKRIAELMQSRNRLDRISVILDFYSEYKKQSKENKTGFSILERELFDILKIHANQSINFIGSTIGQESIRNQNIEKLSNNSNSISNIPQASIIKSEDISFTTKNKNEEVDFDKLLDGQIDNGIE